MIIAAALIFFSILIGMAISVKAFGTGGKRAHVIKDIYFTIEETDGVGITYTKNGDYSAIIKMESPISKYSAETDKYYDFAQLMASISFTLGEGFIIQKQDIFARKVFNGKKYMKLSDTFYQKAYFRFFSGRSYMTSETYLCITQENRKSALFTYDSKKWEDFFINIHKVLDILHDAEIQAAFLKKNEVISYVDRYYAQNFKDCFLQMSNIKVNDEQIGMGERICKIYSLVDVDTIALPGQLRPFREMIVNNAQMPVDLISELDKIPEVESVVYNQVVFMPNQRKEIGKLEKKRNRHASLPSPGNQIVVEDINKVLDVIARESKQLVKAHFNLVITVKTGTDIQKCTNFLENSFSRLGIHISKRAYNQLDLYVSSFPGNCSSLSGEYDRFLTLSDAAFCLFYKERQTVSEVTDLKFYYTDRQGVPIALDLTGKEGKVKLTDNSNSFVLGPSGSGKSFFMNTVARQYYEQSTDIIIIDTGDSYENLCYTFGGRYISYSKDTPISMNPFKITDKEYQENFGEKQQFIKNLIFLIFKGAVLPSKLEETIINTTISDYYVAYFNPFKGYTTQEREILREQLLLEDKRSGAYEKFEEQLQDKYDEEALVKEVIKTDVDEKHQERLRRLQPTLEALANDESTTDGERMAARSQLSKLTPQTIKNAYLAKLDKKIDRMEQQRIDLKVTELSFNSFYEYAIGRIPQIMKQDHVNFLIDNFAAILKPFYQGGNLDYILNNDMDATLFDEKFIVFEIDKIKGDSVLFPIIVLIIMDVFNQKMRLKDGRKTLILEEAWKAISTPIMANYILYLYKTARKCWASVCVVTQDIEDIISSDIVRNAIINNSGVFMLLDQSKVKDKFDVTKQTLGLTGMDCKKIFTINRVENKEGRSDFKEVFIKRGQEGMVVGVEEPPECYMCYTTEKVEKTALKLYRTILHCSSEKAIEVFVRDWQASDIVKLLDFSKRVMSEKKLYRDWKIA